MLGYFTTNYSFPQFPDFPPEIQLRIWEEAALTPQVVVMGGVDQATQEYNLVTGCHRIIRLQCLPYTHPGTPAVLHTCRVSFSPPN